MTFSVTLANMTDGTVQGHKAGCRDLTTSRTRKGRSVRVVAESLWTIEVETKRDAFLDYNADFLAEGQDEDDVYQIEWAPCTDEVPAVDYRAEAEAVADTPAATVKRGRKWTNIYAADGSLLAEIRNDACDVDVANLI